MRKRVMVSLLVVGLACAVAPRALRAQSCDDGLACTVNDMCSNGECSGTPQSGGGCDDFNDCTINDTCQPDGSCKGSDAPEGTSCQHGCGTCQKLAPVPGLPLTCGGDAADNGKSCDYGVPCLTGSCLITDLGVPGFPNPASCLPAQKVCPDTDGNPCTDNCNFQTGQCEKNASRCDPNCESCNQSTGACQPKNLGGACDDFDVCSAQSRCEAIDLGGGVTRAFCMPGQPTVTSGSPTPTATPVGATATATATRPPATSTATAPPSTPTPTLPAATLTSTATHPPATPPTPAACVGDCGGDTEVDDGEIEIGIEIALGRTNVFACPAFDVGIPGVTIEDIVLSVISKRNGCV